MTTTAQTQSVASDNPRDDSRAPAGRPGVIITRDGERVLSTELELIRRELEGGMAQRLREARGFGGPTENDDYLQIKEEETVLAAHAGRLEELLEKAEIVDRGSFTGKAAVGTIVEVRNPDSGELTEHELVGGHEAPRVNVVSAGSPIGQALIGGGVGEIVEIQPPRGGSRRLEIVSVRPAGE